MKIFSAPYYVYDTSKYSNQNSNVHLNDMPFKGIQKSFEVKLSRGLHLSPLGKIISYATKLLNVNGVDKIKFRNKKGKTFTFQKSKKKPTPGIQENNFLRLLSNFSLPKGARVRIEIDGNDELLKQKRQKIFSIFGDIFKDNSLDTIPTEYWLKMLNF